VKAIVVYPMNALANSQRGELEKVLTFGYGYGKEPVTLVDARQAELGLECDDYLRVSAGTSPLDALQRLVQFETTSRTTRALHADGRMDLSIEAQVLEWSDLPLATDLTDSARGRLDYWSSS
jgi:hypothetical protein